MTGLRRLAAPLGLWLIVMCALAFVVARGQAQERERLIDRFSNRADTGSEFVTAYVDDVFDVEQRFSAEVSQPGWTPSDFAHTSELLGFSAAVLLDDDGRVVAVSPADSEMDGTDLAVRYRHLSTALGGTPTVSNIVPSAVEGDPIVAFAMPVTDHERFAVFSGAYSLADGPLGTFFERNPIPGTHGVLLDAHGQAIVSAGEKSALARSLMDRFQETSYEPIVTSDRVVVAAPVRGTGWTYILDAPRATLLAPGTANDLGEWVVLGFLALISLGGLVVGLRSRAAHELTQREKTRLDVLLRLTVEQAPVGMALVDLEDCIVEPNRRLCQMLDYAPGDLNRLTFDEITHPDDVSVGVVTLSRLRTGEIDSTELEKRLVRSDGSVLWGRLSVSVVRDEAGAPAYLVKHIEDVTEVRKARAELQQRALYDPLTGLANRSLLMDRLSVDLGNDRHRGNVGLGFCDLDHFKRVNDTYGHPVGDEVLKEVARRLQDAVRADDTVARLGGDEFIILLHEVSSLGEATAVMERAARAIKEPILVGDVTLWTSLSAGLAIAPSGSDPDVLLRDADQALYVAKNGGRGRVEVHDHHRHQVRGVQQGRV